MAERLTCHRLDPNRAAPLLEHVMPIGDGQIPVVVLGWRDSRKRLRKVRADYSNGWRLEMRLNSKGEITSRSGRIKLEAVGRKRA